MSDVIQFPQRQSPEQKQDETDRLLQRLLATVAIAERGEAQANTGDAIAPTNQIRIEFKQAAFHMQRAYRLAVEQITQPPRGAA